MWCLMGRSVGTYLLITHWELLISLDACLVIVFIWETDMLIDYLACLSIMTLILPWSFCSSRMYRLIVVYHLTWCVDFLACIFSWSSLSMLSLSLFVLIVIFLFSSCVDMDDIFVLCLTVCCMTTLFLCNRMLLVCVGRTSILLATLASMIDILANTIVCPLLIESRSVPIYCCLIDEAELDDGLPWYHDIY